MTFAFIQTGRGVTLFFGAKPVPVDQTHYYYNEILEELKKGADNLDVTRLLELSNIPEAIKGKLFGDVTVTDGEIYFKNRRVDNTLTAKMLHLMSEGWDIAIWANFLNNVMNNPSETAINELYLFLEKAQMPLTPDGHFLAFKKVRNDYTSIHDGKTDNSIGSKPSMPREKVDPNRDTLCSHGLHFCAHDYLKNFGNTSNARVVILKINPADVVSIPSDYENAKGRAWTYEVVGEIDNPGIGERDKRFDAAVDTSWDAPEVEDDEWDYRDEDKNYHSDAEDQILEAYDLGVLSDDERDEAKARLHSGILKEMPHEEPVYGGEVDQNLPADYKEVRYQIPTTKFKISRNTDDSLFGDVYTAAELLKEVKHYGSIRAAGRALGIAKSTFGDWVKRAKEIEAGEEETKNFTTAKNAVIKAFSDELGDEVSDFDERLYDYYGIDELDIIELLMHIEEALDIEIDDDAEDLIELTVNEFIARVVKEL